MKSRVDDDRMNLHTRTRGEYNKQNEVDKCASCYSPVGKSVGYPVLILMTSKRVMHMRRVPHTTLRSA